MRSRPTFCRCHITAICFNTMPGTLTAGVASISRTLGASGLVIRSFRRASAPGAAVARCRAKGAILCSAFSNRGTSRGSSDSSKALAQGEAWPEKSSAGYSKECNGNRDDRIMQNSSCYNKPSMAHRLRRSNANKGYFHRRIHYCIVPARWVKIHSYSKLLAHLEVSGSASCVCAGRIERYCGRGSEQASSRVRIISTASSSCSIPFGCSMARLGCRISIFHAEIPDARKAIPKTA